MRKKLGFHRRRLLREETRECWSMFLLLFRLAFEDLYRFRPKAMGPHFRTEIQEPCRRARERQRKRNPGADREPTPQEKKELKEFKPFYEAFTNLLTAEAKKEKPTSRDLRRLTDALNRELGPISYPQPRGIGGPYAPFRSDEIRTSGELLLRYLNLIARSGAVHGLCEVCGGLMTLAQGKKKVCSSECRGRKWGYPARKSFLKKQRELKPYRDKIKRLLREGRIKDALIQGDRLLSTGKASKKDKVLIESLRTKARP